ncbi:SSPO protein, partial [Cephalopterus ornatus]|nr:SSPO protein [Cephalopterus ornatus]
HERGRWRVPGERWRGGPCQVCQCLPGGGVRCVPYCPLRDTGCPQGHVLREGDGGSCCSCSPAGEWRVREVPGGARVTPRGSPLTPSTPSSPTAVLAGLPSGTPRSAETSPAPLRAAGDTPRTVTLPEETPRA